MKRLIAISASVGAVAALVAGCGGSSGKASNPPPASSSAPAASNALHAQSSKYGQILVDGGGRTLYLLTADTGSQPTCYSACAGVWHPDTTTGPPASSGVTASLVGTTARTDNTTQVTYNGHPLYTYTGDAKSGDVNGQGIATFGGIWYVVGVDGKAVTAAPSASSSSGGGSNY